MPGMCASAMSRRFLLASQRCSVALSSPKRKKKVPGRRRNSAFVPCPRRSWQITIVLGCTAARIKLARSAGSRKGKSHGKTNKPSHPRATAKSRPIPMALFSPAPGGSRRTFAPKRRATRRVSAHRLTTITRCESTIADATSRVCPTNARLSACRCGRPSTVASRDLPLAMDRTGITAQTDIKRHFPKCAVRAIAQTIWPRVRDRCCRPHYS